MFDTWCLSVCMCVVFFFFIPIIPIIIIIIIILLFFCFLFFVFCFGIFCLPEAKFDAEHPIILTCSRISGTCLRTGLKLVSGGRGGGGVRVKVKVGGSMCTIASIQNCCTYGANPVRKLLFANSGVLQLYLGIKKKVLPYCNTISHLIRYK